MDKSWWNDNDMGIKERTRATLSTTNPVRNALRLNSGLLGKIPGINGAANGTAARTFQCHLICSTCVNSNKPAATCKCTFQCMAFTHAQKAIKCSANRHTAALDGRLDRSTYHSIWWGGVGWGELHHQRWKTQQVLTCNRRNYKLLTTQQN